MFRNMFLNESCDVTINQAISFADDECGKMVTVMVNNEETNVDFVDVPVESVRP